MANTDISSATLGSGEVPLPVYIEEQTDASLEKNSLATEGQTLMMTTTKE